MDILNLRRAARSLQWTSRNCGQCSTVRKCSGGRLGQLSRMYRFSAAHTFSIGLRPGEEPFHNFQSLTDCALWAGWLSCWNCMIKKSIQKVKNFLRIWSAHLFCCSRLFVSDVQCDVGKLPYAVVRRTLSRGKCRDSCGHGFADWESRQLWGARRIRFLQADEFLGYLPQEASSRVELFCCPTMHVHILPGRHKPCYVSNFIRTSSSILRTVWTWHRRTFFCFQKWRCILLVNAP